MAIINTRNPTLLDYGQAMDPNDRIARTIELLTQTNELLTDMVVLEANDGTNHKTSMRTGLPLVVWRQLYKGVPPSKSGRATVTDTTGMLEARAEIDLKLYQLYGNGPAFRASEQTAFLESMNQTMGETVIYGNASVQPERFTGLAARYSSLSAGNAANIIDAGGTGADNTSVWLVCWGENTVHAITPEGLPAGLNHRDLGEMDAFDADGNRFRALHDLWEWNMGLTLRDWRFVVRIANIDVSDLKAQTGTQAPTAGTALIKLMMRALDLIPSPGLGRMAFYANRTVSSYLNVAAMDRTQNVLAIEAGQNQFRRSFLGTPMRRVDQILNTEARVV